MFCSSVLLVLCFFITDNLFIKCFCFECIFFFKKITIFFLKNFSPCFASQKISHLITNNKEMWQKYHADAIAETRSGKSSAALDGAYPINAFGDHFLTDAFSAGHLVNKELVMNKFVANVTSGGKVNLAGEALFRKVADGVLA